MVSVGYFQVGGDAAEFGREVAQAVVGENGDDHADVWIAMSDFEGGRNITARGDAAEDALFTRQAARHFERLIRSGGHDAIEVFYVEHLRYEAVANAFDFMRSPGTNGEDSAFRRLGSEHLEDGVLVFEEFEGACHG